jgi:hypothetical protein
VRRLRARWLPRGPRDVALWLGCAAAVVVTACAGYVIGAGTFSDARSTLLEMRERRVNALAEDARNRRDRPAQQEKLQSFADRTLGGDLTAVDSALRARLNRIGEELRLSELRVATERSTARQSPARGMFERTGAQKKLRDEQDFVEIPASIAGEGTVEQAFRLLHRLEVEPWLKRIESVRIDQQRDGERVKIAIKLATIFLPDRKGGGDLRPSDEALARFEQYRAIVAANPFRVPPKEAQQVVAQAPVAPPPQPAPAGFPYEQWLLTGLVEGPGGIEAWLRNGATGERLLLVPGQRVGDAVFHGAQGDAGEFTQDEQRFRVQIGQAMSARAPAG